MQRFELRILPEMEVDTIDGKRIGKVVQVWERPPVAPAVVGETDATVAWDPTWTTDEAGYVQVHRGLPGFLGQDLYIPFSAVDDVVPRAVVLSVRSDQLDDEGWDVQPDFLADHT